MYILLFLNLFLFNSDSVLVKSSEVGDYINAVSVTSDGKSNIYVLDAVKNEIIKYDDNLKEIKRAGKKGWANGEFDSPTSIDGSSGLELNVSDGKNYRIQKFDLNLSYTGFINPNYETYQDNFKYQTPVATVYINPYLYSIDGENNRVVTYQIQNQNMWTPAFSFGGFQSAQKPMSKPTKIVKDGFSNIYILDKKLHAVFKYDNFGNYFNSLENEKIISISAFNNTLFILTDTEVLVYDAKRNAFTDKILFTEKINTEKIQDFMVFSSSKFYILERNKLIELILK
jgi:tripartite motif-containing protein 71